MLSTNGHGPKKAILYARVSTDEQAAPASHWPNNSKPCGSTSPEKATRS